MLSFPDRCVGYCIGGFCYGYDNVAPLVLLPLSLIPVFSTIFCPIPLSSPDYLSLITPVLAQFLPPPLHTSPHAHRSIYFVCPPLQSEANPGREVLFLRCIHDAGLRSYRDPPRGDPNSVEEEEDFSPLSVHLGPLLRATCGERRSIRLFLNIHDAFTLRTLDAFPPSWHHDAVDNHAWDPYAHPGLRVI